MRGTFWWLLLILVIVAVVLVRNDAHGACLMSYCKTETAAPTRSYIANTHRQIVADIYTPGHGRRIQIRDTNRRIVGYIEADSTITNTNRQRIGQINER